MERDWVFVKEMTKSSYEFMVPNYRARCDGSAVGQVIESPPFVVGGYSFRILYYPQGKNEAAHSSGCMSMFIINDGPTLAECVYELCILEQKPAPVTTIVNAGFSSYEDRIGFRKVLIVRPHSLEGHSRFLERDLVEDYVVGDCIKIRAKIGVFHLRKFYLPLDFDPCIFFQLECGTRYFAEESVLRKRCPHLLPYNYRYVIDIDISDIKRHTFEAVLWFIYHGKLHNNDREAVYVSEPSDLNSFALSMLAAADLLNMKHLRRQCESILSGDIEEHGLCYTITSNFGKLWSGARRLLDSPTKIKNA